jgi:pyridoxine 5'-phosphate synthase PdxJ
LHPVLTQQRKNATTNKEIIMPKKEKLDPETEALIQWCTEVEKFLVKGGATLEQAQQHIEEEVEWFTDQFYDGLTPEEAANEALN